MSEEKRLSVSGETLYAILDLPKDCSQEDIKKQYRKKALRLHPDKNPDNPEAEELFKKLNYANRILSDEKKRKIYDYHGSVGLQAVEMMGDGVIPIFLLVSKRWFQFAFWCTFCCSGCCCCLCCCYCCNGCCRGCGGRCNCCGLCKGEEEDNQDSNGPPAFQPEDVHTSQPKSSSTSPFVVPPPEGVPNEATALNPSETKTSYSSDGIINNSS